MTDTSDRTPPPDDGEGGSADLELTLERAETLVARAQEVFETTGPSKPFRTRSGP